MAASAVTWAICLALMMLATAQAQTMPTGCSYTDGLFECSHSTLSSNSLLPLAASSFNPIAQRVRLTDLSGSLTTAIFGTDFANISTASYDTNYPATLELECVAGSSITVAAGFLANMGHIEDFKILNCGLGSIPASAFSDLGELDRFTIENGTIDTISTDLLSGVTIRRNTSISPSYPKKHGEFRILNTKTNDTFSANILTGQTSMYSLVLRGMGLTSLDASVFAGCPNIRYLDISDNSAMTTLTSGLLSPLVNLAVINLYGMTMECSCANLWFMKTVADNYLTLNGDIICNNGLTDWNYKLAWNYYYDTCVEEPKECSTGILLLEACLSYIEISGFSVGFIAFVLGWVTLGLAVNTRKNMGGGAGTKRKPGAKKRPPPKKKAKSGWPA